MTASKTRKTASTELDATLTFREPEGAVGVRTGKIWRTSNANTASELPSRNLVLRAAIALAAVVTFAQPRRLGESLHGLSSGIAEFDGATAQQVTRVQIQRELYRVLALARDETFYEGLSSAFGVRLRGLVLDFGAPLITELASVLSTEGVPAEIGFEALTSVADLKFASIAAERRSLLERALLSPLPEIRYGAALGAAAVRDPSVVPALRKAIEREQIGDLRRNLAKILAAISRA